MFNISFKTISKLATGEIHTDRVCISNGVACMTLATHNWLPANTLRFRFFINKNYPTVHTPQGLTYYSEQKMTQLKHLTYLPWILLSYELKPTRHTAEPPPHSASYPPWFKTIHSSTQKLIFSEKIKCVILKATKHIKALKCSYS